VIQAPDALRREPNPYDCIEPIHALVRLCQDGEDPDCRSEDKRDGCDVFHPRTGGPRPFGCELQVFFLGRFEGPTSSLATPSQ